MNKTCTHLLLGFKQKVWEEQTNGYNRLHYDYGYFNVGWIVYVYKGMILDINGEEDGIRQNK